MLQAQGQCATKDISKESGKENSTTQRSEQKCSDQDASTVDTLKKVKERAR